MKSSQGNSSQVKPSQIKSDQVNPSQFKSGHSEQVVFHQHQRTSSYIYGKRRTLMNIDQKPMKTIRNDEHCIKILVWGRQLGSLQSECSLRPASSNGHLWMHCSSVGACHLCHVNCRLHCLDRSKSSSSNPCTFKGLRPCRRPHFFIFKNQSRVLFNYLGF